MIWQVGGGEVKGWVQIPNLTRLSSSFLIRKMGIRMVTLSGAVKTKRSYM